MPFSVQMEVKVVKLVGYGTVAEWLELVVDQP